MILCVCAKYSGRMTARRRSGQESVRRANRRGRPRGRPPLTLDAAAQRVRSAVAVAHLVGHLTAGERRALDALIATLARLLDEPLPD
jgi:hypothetical protein